MSHRSDDTISICSQRIIRETIGKNPMPIIISDGYIIERQLGQFNFGRIPFSDAKRFIEQYEWLGYIGRGRICYGIWRDNLLFGVEVFCPLPFLAARAIGKELSSQTLYLSRGACCLEAGEHSASMLIGACLRNLRRRGYKVIVAYADPNAGERGVIYRATNAVFCGMTTAKGTSYVLIDDKWYSPKSLYNRFGMSDHRKLPSEVLVQEIKIDSTNKYRFVWLLDKRIELPMSWRVNAQPF